MFIGCCKYVKQQGCITPLCLLFVYFPITLKILLHYELLRFLVADSYFQIEIIPNLELDGSEEEESYTFEIKVQVRSRLEISFVA